MRSRSNGTPFFSPVLTNPHNSFTSDANSYYEAGTIIPLITFTASFNQGSIIPKYTSASPYRSGLPNTYTYTSPSGTPIPSPIASTALSDIETVATFTVLAGANTWTNTVSYDAGVQPKNNDGTDYSTPLPAGTTGAATVTIDGIYPYYWGLGSFGNNPSAADIQSLTKSVTPEGNKTVTLNQNAERNYFAYDASYPDLAHIWDNDGVGINDTITDYVKTIVSITGLDGNPVNYKVYSFDHPAGDGSPFTNYFYLT